MLQSIILIDTDHNKELEVLPTFMIDTKCLAVFKCSISNFSVATAMSIRKIERCRTYFGHPTAAVNNSFDLKFLTLRALASEPCCPQRPSWNSTDSLAKRAYKAETFIEEIEERPG